MSVYAPTPRRKATLVALAMTAVLAAPTAQARRSWDSPGYATSQPQTQITTVKAAAVRRPVCHRARYPDDCRLPARVVAVARADGFDWRDAGIGAGGALGGVLVASGFGVLLRRPRRVAA